MKSIMKKISAFFLAGALALSSSGCSRDDTITLNFYNWGDYIDQEVLNIFTQETGIKINYENYSSNEDMYAKIKTGGTSYDLCIPSDYMIEKLIVEDMVEPINFENIPNFTNIDNRFTNLAYDPKNTYSVPYMWGTVGILYNTTLVDEEVDSWDILWDSKYYKEIFMYDSQRDSIAVALKKLNYSINTRNLEELEAAKIALIEQKPLVQAYVGDPVKDNMISGQGALAVVYSGDAMESISQNEDLAYAIPKEGSNIWFDAIVIPKGSKNKAATEQFINFLCRPDIAVMNTEYIGYSTVNRAALEELGEDYINDPVYWPSNEVIENCEVFLDLGEFVKEYDRVWTEVLAAK